MSIATRCPDCNARVSAPTAAAGKSARCPKCGATVPIPDADEAVHRDDGRAPRARRRRREVEPEEEGVNWVAMGFGIARGLTWLAVTLWVLFHWVMLDQGIARTSSAVQEAAVSSYVACRLIAGYIACRAGDEILQRVEAFVGGFRWGG